MNKNKQNSKQKLNIAVICGGPSLERGISLNSARSVLDHLGSEQIEIQPIYADFFGNFYALSKSQLYSNTPSDFDFKLARMAQKLTEHELSARLKSIDLVFPVIHGTYGEDGTLQQFLEQHSIPFIGCGSTACKSMFYKNKSAKILEENGYTTIPSELLKIDAANNEQIMAGFFDKHNLDRAVIKPVAGGSSIGVFSVYNVEEAMEKMQSISNMKLFKEVIIEPFCQGREFTIIVLGNENGSPVALVPTDISVSYEKGQIFDYRRKYLPTSNTSWHCPPLFNDNLVAAIRAQAEQLFKLFNMRDFARLDGWILEGDKILFSDLNPISGMEQNSFIFQQASRLGLTHHDLLSFIVKNACRRNKILFPQIKKQAQTRKPVYVIFGGNTAERQVSLMSGTNVWLKLRASKIYEPTPYFLDKKGEVWRLPYTYALNHTTEEIYENCLTANATADRLEKLAAEIHARLGLANINYNIKENLPHGMSFQKFLEHAKSANAFVFLGLHGGEGEDGTIQQKLSEHDIRHNGSAQEASELCMDKYLTGLAITQIGDEDICTAAKKSVEISIFEAFTADDYEKFWLMLEKELRATNFVIKPKGSGCSAGVVRIFSAKDLAKYVSLIRNKVHAIPADTFFKQHNIVEMEFEKVHDLIIENYIETDTVVIQNNELLYKKNTGWIELTAGVLEQGGAYHALSPSITVAEGEVLSLEEKFQGGTGINITPPPESIVDKNQCAKIKANIEKVAAKLGIKNYARIDIFFNVDTEKMLVIEANTLPGLTPSTVIYHQALAENPPLYPVAFLEKIIAAVELSRNLEKTHGNKCGNKKGASW